MLIVFIDALPYEKAKELDSIRLNLTSKPLTPGYGYSVNLHTELFSGKSPDEVGFFGEWLIDLESKSKSSPYRMLEKFEKIVPQCVSRVFRLGINRLFKAGFCYIPAKFLHYFKQAGVYPLVESGKVDSILDQFDFKEFIADRTGLGLGKKDQPTYELAMKSIANGDKDIFVSMCDLDGLYHEFGTKSNIIQDKLDDLDNKLGKMFSKYRKKNNKEPIIVLSDHGICDVDKEVDLDLSKFSKDIERGDLVYFYDSLYLQVWSLQENEKLLSEVDSFLLGNYPLHKLNDKSRIENGITSREFGDNLYLLNEGAGFVPNFFGFRCLKSYHGYCPSNKNSKGVLASNVDISGVEKNIDVYNFLKQYLAEHK